MKSTSKDKQVIESLISGSGITLNGHGDCNVKVLDDRFYRKVLAEGSLGLGESYMEGWWETDHLDDLFFRILRLGAQKKISKVHLLPHIARAVFLNLGSKTRAFEVGEQHYDIGNELYSRMLDKRMVYSCGYWKQAKNLEEAQEAKLDLICKKIKLEPGMKVLDIGCGWASFTRYAAEKYGAKVTGITISKEQAELAKEVCKGLEVDIRLQDYRDLDDTFDRVVSIGMFEHVGYKNYRTYMKVVKRLLKDDGLFLLHTIGGNVSSVTTDRWIDRYIFSNGMLPSIAQIGRSIENLFVMEDWHNFSADYDKTLMAWYHNFERAWPEIKGGTYDERFYRMWKYYLLSCAGSFRARHNQLWQIVLSPKGVVGGYESVR